MASTTSRAQLLTRLLSAWEVEFGLRFSSSHIPGVENTTAAKLFSELTHGWSQARPPTSINELEIA